MSDNSPERGPSAGGIAQRFRGFLPVVVDVETGGFDCARHALLEIAVQPIELDADGWVWPGELTSTHVIPFPGSVLDPKSLEITGIDPTHPFRAAVEEREALDVIFKPIRKALREFDCQRAILVGHNAAFDLGFINAAVARTAHKRNPFHPFSTFDTVTLAGMAYGQTVLSRAVHAAGLDWDSDEAHSAVYDTERTAQLFCRVLNRWHAGQTGRSIPTVRSMPSVDSVTSETAFSNPISPSVVPVDPPQSDAA
jgi:ribonuclease T